MEAAFKLQNAGAKPLEDVQMVITYKSSVGEVIKESKPIVIPKLGPGQTLPVKLISPATATFDYYDMVANFRIGEKPSRVVWQGRLNDPKPEVRIDKLIADKADVRILGHRIAPPEKDKPAYSKARLKNFGALPASDVVITATFYAGEDANSKQIAQWSGGVGDGRLGPGEEKAFQFVASTAPPNYGRVSLKVDFQIEQKMEVAEESPSPPPAPEKVAVVDKPEPSPEPTTTPDPTKPPPPLPPIDSGKFTREQTVETARWEFQRDTATPADVIVRGKVRNGLRDAIRDVRIVLTLTKRISDTETTTAHREEITLPDAMVPGELRPFESRLKNMTAEFTGFSASVDYQRVK